MAELLTAESLREAVEMAAYPDELLDQHGRYWSRWETQVPNHSRQCRKCGKPIRRGYILHPHLETTICPEHVNRRWI